MKEMSIDATVENIAPVTEFVNGELALLRCPERVRHQIDVAIDELFGNIAHYAYDPDVGPATVRGGGAQGAPGGGHHLHRPRRALRSALPCAARRARPPSGAAARRAGDLPGPQDMDDVSYEYKNGQNILRIKKRLAEGEA